MVLWDLEAIAVVALSELCDLPVVVSSPVSVLYFSRLLNMLRYDLTLTLMFLNSNVVSCLRSDSLSLWSMFGFNTRWILFTFLPAHLPERGGLGQCLSTLFLLLAEYECENKLELNG